MFDLIFVRPLTNLLMLLYVALGESLALAIIMFTLILRIALLPLTIRQIQTQKKLQELQPKIQELQLKRKDPSSLTPQDLELVREVSSSCFGSIVPIAIQIPILIGLYKVISEIASINDPSKGGDFLNDVLYFDFLKHSSEYYFKTNFLGLDLSIVPSSLPLYSWEFLPYLLLMLFLFVTQYIHSKMIFDYRGNTLSDASSKTISKNITEEERLRMEMQENINKINKIQMMYVLPAIVALGAYGFYTALSFYWLIQNILSIVQTYLQFNFDGKAFKKILSGGLSKNIKNKTNS